MAPSACGLGMPGVYVTESRAHDGWYQVSHSGIHQTRSALLCELNMEQLAKTFFENILKRPSKNCEEKSDKLEFRQSFCSEFRNQHIQLGPKTFKIRSAAARERFWGYISGCRGCTSGSMERTAATEGSTEGSTPATERTGTGERRGNRRAPVTAARCPENCGGSFTTGKLLTLGTKDIETVRCREFWRGQISSDLCEAYP